MHSVSRTQSLCCVYGEEAVSDKVCHASSRARSDELERPRSDCDGILATRGGAASKHAGEGMLATRASIIRFFCWRSVNCSSLGLYNGDCKSASEHRRDTMQTDQKTVSDSYCQASWVCDKVRMQLRASVTRV